METLRKRALAQLLDISTEEIEVSSYNEQELQAEGGDFLVVTDVEADELWEASLESYLEECIYPELPETTKNYFDDEAWKRDARFDGRGHSLSSYDGHEEYEDIDGQTFYIYRTN